MTTINDVGKLQFEIQLLRKEINSIKDELNIIKNKLKEREIPFFYRLKKMLYIS
jgi:peptidoglycan hydrolase CwlO-like protein